MLIVLFVWNFVRFYNKSTIFFLFSLKFLLIKCLVKSVCFYSNQIFNSSKFINNLKLNKKISSKILRILMYVVIQSLQWSYACWLKDSFHVNVVKSFYLRFYKKLRDFTKSSSTLYSKKVITMFKNMMEQDAHSMSKDIIVVTFFYNRKYCKL